MSKLKISKLFINLLYTILACELGVLVWFINSIYYTHKAIEFTMPSYYMYVEKYINFIPRYANSLTMDGLIYLIPFIIIMFAILITAGISHFIHAGVLRKNEAESGSVKLYAKLKRLVVVPGIIMLYNVATFTYLINSKDKTFIISAVGFILSFILFFISLKMLTKKGISKVYKKNNELKLTTLNFTNYIFFYKAFAFLVLFMYTISLMELIAPHL